jgi:arginine-tRNA-protein transferase
VGQESKESILKFQKSSPCAYFPGKRISCIEYIYPPSGIEKKYHRYLARGYRRIGDIIYRNVCRECKSCIPIRIVTKSFRLSRSQKRTLTRNKDVIFRLGSPGLLSQEKINLYNKYMTSKHKDGDESHDLESVLPMIHYGYGETIEFNYYIGPKLIAVGIVDVASNALSSNYFYYDTEYLDRRLGVFSILKEIEVAKMMGKKYYYLGFFIDGNPKMSYKKFFRQNEILEKGRWRIFMQH